MRARPDLLVKFPGQPAGEELTLVTAGQEGGAGTVPAGHRGRQVGEAPVPGPHPDHGLTWPQGE